MASESTNPKAPQAEVVTTSGRNDTARVGAYTDTNLTKRNVVETAAALDVPPPKTPATSQGDIREVYANDRKSNIKNTAAAIENANVDPPPHSPNSWRTRKVNGVTFKRDPYANNGLDNYQRNQGT